MSSLWTPGGEHRVPDRPGRGPDAPSAAGRGDDASPDVSPDVSREEAAAELARLEEQLLSVPAADVVANHCYGLFELAALHLGRRPPNLDQARLAVDALGAVVDGLGDRLGEATVSLREGLSQIRLAVVQLSSAGQAAQAAQAAEQTEPPADLSD